MANSGVTTGADYLWNTGSSPVAFVGARAVSTMNTRLVYAGVVALTENGGVGNGDGLPNAPGQVAGGAVPQDWAKRQAVPHAVIQGAQDKVKAWQLVFGIKVLNLGQRATMQGIVVTFRANGHTWHLLIGLHDVIEATGVPLTRLNC